MATHVYWRLFITLGTYGVVAEWVPFDGLGSPIATIGGTASADDSANGAAGNAFDGNPSTWWGASGPRTFPHWLTYQFPSAVDIVSFTLAARNDSGGQGPTDFDLQYSDDGSTWFTRYSYRGVDWSTPGQVIAFNAANALPALVIAWRVLVNTSYTSTVLQIAEIVLKGPGGSSIATTRYAATASDTYTFDTTHGAHVAFNGDGLTTYTSTNTGVLTGWVAYRFGSLAEVASFCIQSVSPHGPNSVTLQYSYDETIWNDVGTFSFANTSALQCFSLGGTFPGIFTATGQRGNIDWDQIGLDARHGPAGVLVQYSDGTGITGNLASYLPDGSLTDSGIGGGAGGAPGLPVTVNGIATIQVNSAPVSFDATTLVNGV